MMATALPPPPKVQRTTFAFKSDLRKSSTDHHAPANGAIPVGGILHATRSTSPLSGLLGVGGVGFVVDDGNGTKTTSSREEHAFAWVSDYDAHVHIVVSHLERYGFPRDDIRFVPYSCKSAWVYRYPHAYPYVNCDVRGNVTGFPHYSPSAISALDIPPEIVDASTSIGMVEAIARGEREMERHCRVDVRGRGAAIRGRGGRDRLSDFVTLNNAERDALHVEIYKYFAWLSSKVVELETTESGRRSVKRADYTASGLRGLLSKLEGTFKAIGVGGGVGGSGGVGGGGVGGGGRRNDRADAAMAGVAGGGVYDAGGGGDRKAKGEDDHAMDAPAPDDANDEDEDDDDPPPSPPLPLLEVNLTRELSDLAATAEEARKRQRAERGAAARAYLERRETSSPIPNNDGVATVEASTTSSPPRTTTTAHWEPLDFDVMFERLVAYMNEYGHPNVPVKYAKDMQLGGWVSGLRTKKKAYSEGGGGGDAGEDGNADVKNDDGNARGEGTTMSIDGVADGTIEPPPPANYNQKYLNPERIKRLESIGFSWSMSKTKTKSRSWEERLDDLVRYRDEIGSYNVPRNSSLGEWLHNQRTLYGKRDKKFMSDKAPRMVAIGYAFDLRENNSVSWDDRYQQLAEYKHRHGNFDVPCPMSASDDAGGGHDGSDLEDRFKFYKWVNRLHNEYRAFEKGTASKLNAERVAKLRSIGFQFKGPKNRGRPSGTGLSNPVPKIPFEKRIQQLQAFKADTGHLDVDHNYKHCSNLGGWAADVTSQYASWKSGATRPSEEMIARFDQLAKLGFQFNCLPYYESNRSWEDHYDVLLKFKEQHNGSARVPLKYKADLRLGKWVQSQRQQYKLRQEGKRSKLTEERIEKLEAAGFDWALLPGSTKDDDEDDDDEMGEI